MRRLCVAILVFGLCLAVTACGCGDDDDNDSASGDDDSDDDAGDDDSIDDDADDDATDDDTVDDDLAECVDGDWTCSEDAHVLSTCEGGAWVETDCLSEHGQLCENGACVDRWRYGSPVYDACADDPHATSASLATKAANYDDRASRIHLCPDDNRIHRVTLTPGKTEDDATTADVIDWHPGENDGLWTGLYIASQAFRYAVTHSADALDNLRNLMDGMKTGMAVTGVPGIFTREFIVPGVTGMSCPASDSSYIPDVEKDDNKWVKIDTDGTVLVYDAGAADYVRTTHQVPAEYAGYCFLDNVSKDEYSGHMLALAAVLKLVDDQQVHDAAVELARQVGEHLMENDLSLVDWDGRVTEHGRFWTFALDDYPGFNASMALSYVLIAADATGDADLREFYDNCLLQRGGPNDCLDQYLTPPVSFADWLWFTGLYFGSANACKSNWNNFSMMWLSMFQYIWYLRDADVLDTAQDIFENHMFYFDGNTRQMADQHNASWAILYAAMKGMGPGSTGPDTDAVRDAVCGLREFPESWSIPDLEVGEAEFPTDPSCESRFPNDFLTYDPVPVWERCPNSYVWWFPPYEHQSCDANPQVVEEPAAYLLPYWAARYFGFIGEND